VGSREKSNPARRLNRVWPDTGPTDNRLTAAKDRTFKTVRPNQGTASGACGHHSPPPLVVP